MGISLFSCVSPTAAYLSRHKDWVRPWATRLLLASILGLALYLRLSAARSLAFYEDDYGSALVARGFQEHWRPVMPSGFLQLGEPLALPFLVSLLGHIATPSVMMGRVIAAAIGTASVLAAFFLGRRIRNTFLGIVLAGLVSVNTWSLASSAYFRSYSLGELGFLAMCHVAVSWFRTSQSLREYILVVFVAIAAVVVGHYLLFPALAVVVAMPIISWLADVVGRRVCLQAQREGMVGNVVSARIAIVLDTRLVLVAVGALLVAILGAYLLFMQGPVLAKAIGKATGEFFEVLPEHPVVTVKPFFAESLTRFYGAPGLMLVAVSSLLLACSTGRVGVTLLLMVLAFLLPFSTVFPSLSMTAMFDRYLFPYNIVLLLSLALLLVLTAERLFAATARSRVQTWVEWVGLMGGAAIIVFWGSALIRSGSFVLPFRLGGSLPSIEEWIRSRGEPRTPSYEKATSYIRSHMSAGDVVMYTRGYEVAYELPNARAYWLVSSQLAIAMAEETSTREPGQTVNRYTGDRPVTTGDELLRILGESPGTWVMLPYFHNNPGYLSKDMYGLIHTWMDRVPEASDSTIEVFRLTKGAFRQAELNATATAYGGGRGVDVGDDGWFTLHTAPADVNWAGLQLDLPRAADIRDFGLRVAIDVTAVDPAQTLTVNVYHMEEDGDRWQTGTFSVPMNQQVVQPVAFTDLSFWALGANTREPDKIKATRIEFAKVGNVALDARIRVQALYRGEDPSSPKRPEGYPSYYEAPGSVDNPSSHGRPTPTPTSTTVAPRPTLTPARPAEATPTPTVIATPTAVPTPTPIPPPLTNLLSNGDFSAGLDGWDTNQPSFVAVMATAPGGPGAIRLNQVGSSKEIGVQSKRVRIVGSATYVVSAQVRAEQPETAMFKIAVAWYGADGKVIGYNPDWNTWQKQPATSTWEVRKVAVVAPAGAVGASLLLGARSDTVVLFTDVILGPVVTSGIPPVATPTAVPTVTAIATAAPTPATVPTPMPTHTPIPAPSANLLPNGGFFAGFDGWSTSAPTLVTIEVSGPYRSPALRVEQAASTTEIGVTSKRVRVVGDATYVVEGLVRAEQSEPTKFKIAVGWYGADGKVIAYNPDWGTWTKQPATSSWEARKVAVVAPAGAVEAAVMLGAQPGSIVLFAGLVFGPIDPSVILPVATPTPVVTPTLTPTPTPTPKPSPATHNLLLNGDFENGNAGWQISDFTNINIVPDGHSGSALRVRRAATAMESVAVSLRMRVSEKQWYVVSGWIRALEGASARYKIAAEWTTASGKLIKYVPDWGDWEKQAATGEWTYVAVVAEAPASAEGVRLLIGVQPGTSVQFDDLSFGEAQAGR